MIKVDGIRISLSFQATSKENVSHHVLPNPFTIKKSSQGKWLELVLFRCVESSVSLLTDLQLQHFFNAALLFEYHFAS